MTEIQTIKATAKAAFEGKNYPLAFQTLWKAGFCDFIRFGENQTIKVDRLSFNWFTFPNSAEFFWKIFILDERVFTEIFSSDFSEQMLHNYFYKSTIVSSNFEGKLAKEFPLKFVNAVRLSQVYLKQDRIDQLCSALIPDELTIHQRVWRKINDADKIIWKSIENELLAVFHQPLIDILSHVIIWLETNRFQKPSKETIHHLASVYSCFVELLFSKHPEKLAEQLGGEMLFYRNFLALTTRLYKEKKTFDVSPTTNIFGQISNWINYKECVISPYSFDLDIKPLQENELLLFAVPPESRYRWLLDGARYEVNQLNYLLTGIDFVKHLEESRLTKIPGKTEAAIDSNRRLAALKWSTVLLLNDMGIKSFVIGKSEVKVDTLLDPLITHSYNRIDRYELSLAKHSANSKSWLEAFIKQCMEVMVTTIRREPFLLMSKNEFKELNREAIEHLSEEAVEHMVQLVSYKVDGKFEFNRLVTRYDVFQKPLLRVGENLFCPMIFFASNLWFYSFAQEALTRFKLKQTERDETRVMEFYFGEILKQKGWTVKVLEDTEASQLEGDIDIFVEDSDTLLFIQLKRTYFRVTLKDSYSESINTDKKAAHQLNNAEAFLNQENKVYTITKKPIKWIVSTSFENIGNSFDGCKKVNYFEVLNAVKNPVVKTLSDLIVDVEQDRNLRKMAFSIFDEGMPAEVRQLLSTTGVPVRLFETREYRQTIFTEDETKTANYNELFNEAMKCDSDGKKNDALILLQKCLSLNPSDAEVYGAIANTLADIKLYERAFPLFMQALKLAPNDPYITRNFAIALMEFERFYDGLSLILRMFGKFPLLSDFRILFEHNFQQCIRHGLLTNRQVLELQTKWNSLK